VLHQRPLRSFHSDPSRVEAKGAVRTMPSPPLRTAFVMPGVDARREGNGRLNFTVTLDHPAAFQASSGGPTEERAVTYDYWGEVADGSSSSSGGARSRRQPMRFVLRHRQRYFSVRQRLW